MRSRGCGGWGWRRWFAWREGESDTVIVDNGCECCLTGIVSKLSPEPMSVPTRGGCCERKSGRVVSSTPKRLISPSGLGFVVLCFFFPFFTVSCSGMVGTLEVTYSGMSLAFNGAPSVGGSLAGELSSADVDDLRAGVQPLLLIALTTALVGGVLSAALSGPLVRAVAGLAAAGLSALLVLLNQIGMHGSVEQAIEEEAGGEALQLAEYSATTGVGFWLALLVSLGVVVYNVVDLVLLKRGPAPGVTVPGGMPPVGGQVPPGFGQAPPRPQGQYPPQGTGQQGQYPPRGPGQQGPGPQGTVPQGPYPPQGPGQQLPPGSPGQPPSGPR